MPHLSDHAVDSALLTYLLERHPAPVHEDELRRAFADVDWRASVATLARDGLAHFEGALILPSRAAVRASELLV